MNRVIILLGQRVRSGTNFVGTTLAQHPDVVTLPKDASLGEFNLFRDRDILDCNFKAVSEMSFGMGITAADSAEFLRLYGELWLQFLIDKYKVPEGKTIFLKSYVIHNLDLWRQAFPNSKIALICRDGRDNVISSIKASNDYRQWHSVSTRLKKRFNFYSGRLFINHTKHWKSTAKVFMNYQDDLNVKKFKYELLNNSEAGVRSLLDFYELDHTPQVVTDCLHAPVVGSSFGYDTKKGKPNWTPDTNKSNYTFTRKWVRWGFLKKSVFKLLAGQALQELDYETSKDW